MKAIPASLLILAAGLAIHFALGASPPDRPAGVDAGHWISVSDKVGFVVMPPQSGVRTVDSEALLLASPDEGYSMVPTLRQGLSQRAQPGLCSAQ